ncbi:MAG: type II secretion system protein GspD [Kangiellaceae bacterium]
MFKLIGCLLLTFLFLSGCSTKQKASSIPLNKKTAQISEQDNQLKKQQLKLQQEKLKQAQKLKIASFYKNIPDCSSGSFSLKDLMVDEIRVSNNDTFTISSTLQVMGYNVLNLQNKTHQSKSFGCKDLPVVVVPFQSAEQKLSFPTIEPSESNPNSVNTLTKSNAAEIDRFLVYYHPKQADQFEKINWLVAERLDIPAAQVYIETMVLEVRQEDSEEFGIDYKRVNGDKSLSLGSLVPGSDILNYISDQITNVDGVRVFTPGYGSRTRLKALIDEGKAEVLSRPSILALSNRQAVIQVVDVIQTPELSSTLSSNGELNISSYEFNPLLIGITLNLRPRVSADRNWLSLEIDATVEAEDDENSGEVFAATESGEQVLLAEKQGSNSKKVKTFVRIPDRTPIIIGGLVGTQNEERESKIPLLGDIPGIGKLFTSIDNEKQKREIIIVLTPYILAEDSTSIHTLQPSDYVNDKAEESILFDEQPHK